MRQQSVCIAVICTMLCPAAYGQWVQTNGPYGGTVRSLLVSSPRVFAGIGDGVYFSADSGKNWVAANTGLPYDSDGYLPYVNALAVNGTNLFAGTDGAHVYRSTNNGTTWTHASMGLPYDSINRASQMVVEFAVMTVPSGGTNLFAAVNWRATGKHGSVFLSTNDGTTWTSVNNGLPDTYVNDLVVSGATLFAGTDSSVFLSTDNGTNWSAARTGLPNDLHFGGMQMVNSLAVSGSNLFAGVGDGGVYLSTDSGKSWTAANSGLPGTQYTWGFSYAYISDLSVVIGLGGTGVTKLYACSVKGVYMSTNNGTSWTEAFAPLPEGTVGKFVEHGAYFLAATETGLVRSTDGATTWNAVPVIATSVRCFDSDASRLFVGVSHRVFCTVDRGSNWSPKGKLSAGYGLYCLAIAGPNLLAGGTCTVGRVDISTDEGLTWRAVLDTTAHPPFSGGKYNAEALLAVEPSVFTAGNGIWMSSDNGNSWKPRDEGILSNSYFFALAALDTNLFAGGGGSGGNMFISNVSGGPWRSAGTGLQGAHVACLTVNGTTLFAGTWSKGVYRSTDLGATWKPASNGLGDSVVLALAGNGSKLFAGTEHQGVFLSTDNGITWTAVNEGLKNMTVHALEIFGLDLYAGTGRLGVWRRPLSELVVSADGAGGTESAHAYGLDQNYPNPFNPSTTIAYGLPKASQVSITIYSPLGQRVGDLVTGIKEAGYHTVTFDGSNLPSGVYFCRMQAGDYVATRKLLLVK